MGESGKNGNETFMKIIMNQEPIEAFDTFVENWKAQGRGHNYGRSNRIL